MHAWDPLTPLDETWRFLDDAVRAGKVRYVGLSNFTGWQIQKAVDLADYRGLARPVTLQPQYNLLVREIEWEIVPACADERARAAAVVAARRRLADRQVHARRAPRRGATRLGEDPERGVEAYDRRSTQERTWDVIDAVRADRRPSAACRWRRSRSPGSSTVRGSRR